MIFYQLNREISSGTPKVWRNSQITPHISGTPHIPLRFVFGSKIPLLLDGALTPLCFPFFPPIFFFSIHHPPLMNLQSFSLLPQSPIYDILNLRIFSPSFHLPPSLFLLNFRVKSHARPEKIYHQTKREKKRRKKKLQSKWGLREEGREETLWLGLGFVQQQARRCCRIVPKSCQFLQTC